MSPTRRGFCARAATPLFEPGFNQHEAVRRLIDPGVWERLDIHRDLQGITRTVALWRDGR